MAPRKKNAAIKSTGSTSSKAEPLPDWVKNKNIAKPPPKYQQQQQETKGKAKESHVTNGTTGKDAAPAGGASRDTRLQQIDAPPRPPPLFPPGTKTPINLLNERIQKHHAPKGWLRPSIEPRRAKAKDCEHAANGTGDGEGAQQVQHADGEVELWTFVVTLTKTNKSDQSNPHIVRFDARDPSGHEGSYIALDSKEKAKHWGATYALFRLCSNLSLDAMLPTGPREYWRTLSSHKAKAPEHLSWLWSADPFEAQRKLVIDKEAKIAAKEKKLHEAENGPRIGKEWLRAPEVRMAKGLREMVESIVRDALLVFPMEDEQAHVDSLADRPAIGSIDEGSLLKKIVALGFRNGHARSAVKWLALARQGQSSSAAASSLHSIAKLSDLDACLEYLAIFCPEDDLPPAFGPSRKADSFVTQASAGLGDKGLALRWIEDRLVKLAGFPRQAVAAALAESNDIGTEAKEAYCVDLLLLQLANADLSDGKDTGSPIDSLSLVNLDIRAEERMTLEAVLGPDRIIDIAAQERPLTSGKRPSAELYDIVVSRSPREDIRLRVCPGDQSSYPAVARHAIPTFYVASSTLPAYLRLALTRRLTRALLGLDDGYSDWQELMSAGQGGVLLSMVEELESCWESIADDPPELSVVMGGLMPTTEGQSASDPVEATLPDERKEERSSKSKRTMQVLKNDANLNQRLKAQQAALWQSSSYSPMATTRASLPAMGSQTDIVRTLESNRILIIIGETGCGKTTQCPQIVLDDMIERGQGSMCNIVVTQPRRLSAMGVAARVAAERCEPLDGKGVVGYSIRGEARSGRDTRLLFTTTGVLLRRLASNDPDLRGISHVFVDEVHERGVDSDLLLLELREVLQRNKTIRVILMSATIERETFAKYFSGAPVMDIPGRTFPVTDHYLEDLQGMLGVDNEDEAEETEVRRKHRSIDYDLVGKAVDKICKKASKEGDTDGGILVFAPGVGEIRLAIEAIQRHLSHTEHVLPLHANLTSDEQRRVFVKPPPGKRKIVVATNVAETSITIDDIVYVLDLGLVKETRYDAQSGLTKLVETRCSQAAARQRRGRAGRVRPGQCFRMYTRATEQYRMDSQQVPEMRRMSLENLILTVKALKGEGTSVGAYLGKAISPPSIEAIALAIQLLGDMGVLVGDERLTALGRHLSLLPVDVRLGKLLVLGCIFHCLEPMLTAAAVLSSKPLFSAPFEKREEASDARARFGTGNSDILTDVNAFSQWYERRKDGSGARVVRQWCDDNFISQSSLRDIASVRADLLGNLVEMGFVPGSYRSTEKTESLLDSNASNMNLLRSLLLAALYPSVVRIVHPQSKYDKAIGGTVERQAEARQVHYMDSAGQRVFLHPSSVLFSTNKYSSEFLASFRRGASSSQQQRGKTASGDKIYLRDATEVPVFSLLLFGGRMTVHRLEGGISMGSQRREADGNTNDERGWIKLRANGRIASLVNQLRFLLDAALSRSFDDPTSDVFSGGTEARIRDCLQRILEHDGQQ